jgi:hypothetical protein
VSKFNLYLNNHFAGYGCRLIARARDTSRGRDVTIHAIPGYWDVVGVSDGTDAWIAPTAAGPFFKTSTGDVGKIMKALEAGDPLPPVPDAPQASPGRRRVILLDDSDASPPRRSRTPLEPAGTAVAQGRRHVLFA